MRIIDEATLSKGAVRFQDMGAGLPALVPVVAQDVVTGAVLMLAWADADALHRSLATGEMHYYSRSRKAPWRKGETSGHTQHVDGLYLDCDGDTVLARVRQTDVACHTGAPTCFQDAAAAAMPVGDVLSALAAMVRARRHAPHAGSYTNRLLDDANLRLKKVGEESGEFLIAAGRDDKAAMAEEAADLLYHVVVALEGADVPLEDVLSVLLARRR